MSITINTNIASLQADRNISKRSNSLRSSFEKLSSGKQINKASDNAAGLAIALDLLGNADAGAVGARNISDGVSVVAVADGALSSASDITTRLSELATQSANGTLSDTQRGELNNEYQSLKSELDRISQTTEFNGQSLLNESGSVDIQAGTNGDANSQISIKLTGVSSASLGLTADISTQAGARQAIDQTKTANQSIASTKGNLGASENRLKTAFNNLQSSEINQREAASRIVDADIAEQSSKLVANKIGLQAGLAVKAQANVQPSLALKLLS